MPAEKKASIAARVFMVLGLSLIALDLSGKVPQMAIRPAHAAIALLAIAAIIWAANAFMRFHR